MVSRLVPPHETRERDFAIQFWQAQGPAAQELLENDLRSNGRAGQ